MINVKIFTICGSITNFDNIPVETCYNIFHLLTDLDDLNSCFDRIVSHEKVISEHTIHPDEFRTVHQQDEEARETRNLGNAYLKQHKKLHTKNSQTPLKFRDNVFRLVAVLFINNKYTGHVYIWKYPNIELAVRVQGIRTSVDNYTHKYFNGVGKTLIDSIIMFTNSKRYRYVTVWAHVNAMTGVLHEYGFDSYSIDFERFLSHNEDLTCTCVEDEEYTQHQQTEEWSDCNSNKHCEFNNLDYIFDTHTMQRSNVVRIDSYVTEKYLLQVRI